MNEISVGWQCKLILYITSYRAIKYRISFKELCETLLQWDKHQGVVKYSLVRTEFVSGFNVLFITVLATWDTSV